MKQNIKKSKLAALIIILATAGVIAWFYNVTPRSEYEYRQQAEQLAQQQDWEALGRLAKHWRNAYPTSSMSYIALGDSMRMRRNFSGAEIEYAKALEQDASNHQIWAYRGIMLLEKGLYAEAKMSCDKSVTLNQQHAEGWYCLSLANAELGSTKAMANALSKLEPLNALLLETASRVIYEHICKKSENDLGKSNYCLVQRN